MPLTYQEILFTCTKMSQILGNNDKMVAFEKCKHLWNTTIDIHDIFSENIFKKTIASNFNHFDNELVYHFILDKAVDHLKDNYNQFLLDLNDYIFKDAISGGYLKNIEKFMPNNFFPEEGLQISIKYGSWTSFIHILDNYIDQQKKPSIIQWSQQQFWQYAVNGYANINFILELIEHPLSVNRTIKKPIYDLIKNSNFEFINDLITSTKGLSLLQEINVAYYYEILFKKIATTKDNVYYKEAGITLLNNSYAFIDFDFSQLSFNTKFKKDNPDLINIINKFILKDKLELLPYKSIAKTLKI